MATVNFSDVPMNKTFTYNGVKYIKDRADKAQVCGTSKPRESFPASYPVEYDGPTTSQVNADADAATTAQLEYLSVLRVNVTRKLTKREASAIIDSVKRGNGCGSFGLNFYDGSN